MVKKILIAVAGIIVVFVGVVAFQPNDFRVSRSATIAAPASELFEHVNDFHQWGAWSPYEKLDPAMKRTYSGPKSGIGAAYGWDSEKQEAGAGRMTILESTPAELIRIKLEFLKPFAATNTAEFTFKPEGENTVVTWSMYGSKNFMFKAAGLFMNMDKMVGGDFEKGLANMKVLAEAASKK